MPPSPATSPNKVLDWFQPRSIRELETPVYTLRSRSATISFWFLTAMLTLTVISAVSGGQTRLAVVTVPVAAFFVWLFSVLLLSPRVSYNRDRVVIVNFARVHDVPWATVSHIVQGIDLVFILNDGRKIHAFGSPYPKRGNALMKTKNAISGRNHDGEAWILDDFRRNARDTGVVSTHHWQKKTLLIGLILFLACVGILLIEGPVS